MKSILFIRQSSVQPGLRHIEGYIETALHANPQLRVAVFDLVTGVRGAGAVAGASREEIIRCYREYFVRVVTDARVDAVLFMNGYAIETFFPGVMKQLHGLNVPLIAWHADDPYYADLQTPLAPYLRMVLTVDSSTVDHWKGCCGNAHFLPLAFAPESVCGVPSCGADDALSSDVCFVGTPFKGSRRVRIIDENAAYLASMRTRIGGAGSVDRWSQNLANAGILGDAIMDRMIDPQEMLRFALGTKVNLNIHKDSFGHVWDHNAARMIARSPNERFFALGGAGAFQLVDDSRPDLFSLLPGHTPATFAIESTASFKEALCRFLADPGERQRIAALTKEAVLAAHTYRHRIDFIRGVL